MNMKRNRMTRREFIDDMEFTRDFTRLPIEAQYLCVCISQIGDNNQYISHVGSGHTLRWRPFEISWLFRRKRKMGLAP